MREILDKVGIPTEHDKHVISNWLLITCDPSIDGFMIKGVRYISMLSRHLWESHKVVA